MQCMLRFISKIDDDDDMMVMKMMKNGEDLIGCEVL